jgi:hypothetical protein
MQNKFTIHFQIAILISSTKEKQMPLISPADHINYELDHLCRGDGGSDDSLNLDWFREKIPDIHPDTKCIGLNEDETLVVCFASEDPYLNEVPLCAFRSHEEYHEYGATTHWTKVFPT